MNEVYFIGGPWDLTKKIFSDKEINMGTIRIAMYSNLHPIVPHRADIESVRKIETEECIYVLRPIVFNPESRRNVYIATYNKWPR